jgi:hypothetical protein
MKHDARKKPVRSGAKPKSSGVRALESAPLSADAAQTLHTLWLRVDSLERQLQSTRTMDAFGAAERAISSVPAVPIRGVADRVGTLVDVELEKQAGSPDKLRISIDNQSTEVLAVSQTRGAIRGVPIGSFVVIWIDVVGEPGANAQIKVSRATPSNIAVTIPRGSTQTLERQTLLITG